MRFTQIDRVEALIPGQKITAIKALTLSEEYLADHFPLFPIMPGVMMLEAMVQAAGWLLRASDEFAHSMTALSEARNIKFNGMIHPGQTLTITAEIVGRDGDQTRFKTEVRVDDRSAVSARLTLTAYNLADRQASWASLDGPLVEQARRHLDLILAPGARQDVAVS